MVGLIATLAPTIGPTIGGYVTDTLSWHWLFFINIVPGLIVTAATYALVISFGRIISLLEHFDWWGLIVWRASSARSNTCWRKARARTGSTTAPSPCSPSSQRCRRCIFARVSSARVPIVDLRAFANRNVAVGSLFSFVLGIGLTA